MAPETPATLLRKEHQANLAGWPKLAAIYRADRRELENRTTCPACNGSGEVEDFYRSMKWHPCRVCDSEGTVRTGEGRS